MYKRYKVQNPVHKLYFQVQLGMYFPPVLVLKLYYWLSTSNSQVSNTQTTCSTVSRPPNMIPKRFTSPPSLLSLTFDIILAKAFSLTFCSPLSTSMTGSSLMSLSLVIVSQKQTGPLLGMKQRGDRETRKNLKFTRTILKLLNKRKT